MKALPFNFTWSAEDKRLYNKWIEFYPKLSGFALTYSPWNYYDGRPQVHIKLLLFELFVFLPFFIRHDKSEECEHPRYGVYHLEDSFVVCTGDEGKYIYYPWSYKWHRTSYLLKNGNWIHESKKHPIPDRWDDSFKEKLWSEVYPYTNVCESGTIDNVNALVRVEERQWRMRWLPFIRRTEKTIDVNFSSEVGRGKGSWKGGVVGCGWVMKKGESPLDALRRMEKERTF